MNYRLFCFIESLKITRLGKMLRRPVFYVRNCSKRIALRTIKQHMSTSSSQEIEEVLSDIMFMAKKYRFSSEEYFYFHFRDKSLQERLKFISNLEAVDIVENINLPSNLGLFNSKVLTYNAFKKYYHRDVCVIDLKEITPFIEFTKRHPRFIIKPLSGSCGKGISIAESIGDPLEFAKKVAREYKFGVIAEEIIIQDPTIAKIHPSSLNTVRITTLRTKDEVLVIHPFIRFGRDGSVVDNGGAGGILCTVIPETGVVNAAADENGIFYERHPSTCEPLVGFTVPRWLEALSLAKELAQVVPSNRYTGWDLALTASGWVMVEGNARGQFVGWQIPGQTGFREEAYHLLEQL